MPQPLMTWLRWRHGDYARTHAHANPNRGTTAVLIGCYGVAMLAAYAVRISSEEALLGKLAGSAYEIYREQSWRLIPFVY